MVYTWALKYLNRDYIEAHVCTIGVRLFPVEMTTALL